MMLLSLIGLCSLLLASVTPETAMVGRIIIACFVEGVQTVRHQFANRRNFDARHLGHSRPVEKSFNSARAYQRYPP
jgi:hypothetical protein